MVKVHTTRTPFEDMSNRAALEYGWEIGARDFGAQNLTDGFTASRGLENGRAVCEWSGCMPSDCLFELHTIGVVAQLLRALPPVQASKGRRLPSPQKLTLPVKASPGKEWAPSTWVSPKTRLGWAAD
ncbi:hypothetical protein L3X38_000931 [Prunus dulcis]|uniref:Uncharacterized protein n=1 Tax=Prunus dulcis TaxID=3755 RepID=A0AAD4WR68_PRUDU|nr:hypothetical protein L3X38_000931 [Prunus dulcis]